MAPPPTDETEAPILAVTDAVGALMEFWGFKRAMGRVWALLYVTPAPMAAQELQDRLTMSAGAVSMTLAELTKWGVVKKVWKPGDRRDYYVPETSIWKMVTRVFRERELQQVRSMIETFEATLKALAGAMKSARKDDKKRLEFASERLGSLLQLAKIGETLISTILAGERIDPAPVMKFLSGGGE